MKIKYVPFIIIAVLLVCLGTSIYKTKKLEKEYQTAMSNVKAYDALTGLSNKDKRALQLTIEQLSYFNDSLLRKMDSIRKVQGIKDKDVKVLQYISSKAEKTDTLILKDTVFVKNMAQVDTVIGDAWYSMRFRLKYPYYIAVTPKFLSQKYITVYMKKETVNPPKKCWLLRLFQKKHKVIMVNVHEQNPYITDSVSRFVEIVK